MSTLLSQNIRYQKKLDLDRVYACLSLHDALRPKRSGACGDIVVQYSSY